MHVPKPATLPQAADLVNAIRQAAGRLQAIYPPPETLSDSVRESADAAVDGVVIVHYQGERRVKLGRRNIIWLTDAGTGEQTRGFVLGTAFIRDLANAYHVFKDERYAEAAHDYLAEYMTAWPTETIGQNHNADNTLTLCGRNANWSRSLHLLAASPAFDAAFFARVVAFVAAQFDYLRHHLSTTINWRVFNARNLLAGGLYLSFLDTAADWREYSVRVLNDAWFRQFLPDGVHYERNPIYHTGMTGTFCDLYRLGRQLPELGLIMTLESLIPAYDFMLACVKPNGYLCGIHDSQSEFTGHRRDNVHTTSHKGVDNNKTWEDFRREFNLPMERPSTSQVFPDAGLAFLRTGWDEDAAWMSFDATQWGGGHCHLSRHAVQLHACRQSMVIDPGWLSYDSNEWGVYGRSTRAHSTCNLNGRNQSSTNPGRLVAYSAPGYDALLSLYEGGYWDTDLKWDFTHAANGLWAQHARILFWVQDRFAFVVDSMFRLPHQPDDPEAERPSYECVWQLAPGAAIDLQPEQNRAIAQWKDAGLLLLTPIRPEGSRYEVHCAEKDPLRGWAPGEGKHHPAPQLVLNTLRMQVRHDYYVSILTPYRGRTVPVVSVDAKSPKGQLGYVRLTWQDGTQDEIHWGCNLNLMLGKQPDFETDSSLVHLRKDAAGRVTGGCCVNGTYLKPFDTTVRAKPATFRF
ncbi:MAG: hypothetical protein A2498_15270 [Lentisphaerae bacterium RIFOXYC12_FULL_60_16]|nr:MAG: hypothetical protein A2498_15270 [Lentisphaerae bacterium RIFOXYC12_FULL_60_16]